MAVPFVDLRPALVQTAGAWRSNLEHLFEQGQFILGQQVVRFEEQFAAHHGARFAVGVGTGTAAIELALRAAALAHTNREVLTSALTSPFTAIAIAAAGCRPRFADVDPDTLLLDPSDAERRITRKTAAIVAVHLYGQVGDLREYRRLARSHGLTLIQDACQAHGARFRSRPLTAFSPCVAYSFYPTKNLGCLGDGGAVLTNSHAIAGRLRLLRDGGRRNGGQVSVLAAINSRLDEMQACYLRAFLDKLEEWNGKRARLAALYDEGLHGCPGIRLVTRSADSVHHLYVIRAARRERLRSWLQTRGIGNAVHYPVPLHLNPAFRGCGLKRGDLPVSERACREVVSLPLRPHLTESQVTEVVEAVRRFYGAR